MAAKLRSSSTNPASFLRLAYSAPAPGQSTAEEIRRFMRPATKALPFVKLRPNDQPLWHPESFWNVVSTRDRERDARLGRKYARAALAAMKADGNSGLITLIVQDMVKDSVERAGKRKSPRLCPIAKSFLDEIGEEFTGPV